MHESVKPDDNLISRLKWDFPTEPSFWAADAPSWAKDPFNDDCTSKCGYCGSWMEVVRPGKSQCPACGSDGDKAARWSAAAIIEQLRRPPQDAKPVASDNDAKAGLLALMEEIRRKAPFGYHDGPHPHHKMLVIHGSEVERWLDTLLNAAIAIETKPAPRPLAIEALREALLDVGEDRQLGIGEGPTQPLAILAALLKALRAQDRSGGE